MLPRPVRQINHTQAYSQESLTDPSGCGPLTSPRQPRPWQRIQPLRKQLALAGKKKPPKKPKKTPNQNRTEPEATAVEEAGGNWSKSCLFRDTTAAPYNLPQIQSIFVGICIL